MEARFDGCPESHTPAGDQRDKRAIGYGLLVKKEPCQAAPLPLVRSLRDLHVACHTGVAWYAQAVKEGRWHGGIGRIRRAGEAAIADLRRKVQNPALLDPAVDLGDPGRLGYFARASLFCGTETGEWGRNLIQDFRVHDFHSPGQSTSHGPAPPRHFGHSLAGSIRRQAHATCANAPAAAGRWPFAGVGVSQDNGGEPQTRRQQLDRRCEIVGR